MSEQPRRRDVVYAKEYLLSEVFRSKENTKVEGVYNYELKSVYAPVLDRKFLKKFNPKKTCISVCANEKVNVDEDKLIKDVIKSVEEQKKYCIGHKTEHFGQYSFFSQIDIEGYMLEEYSFDKDSDGEYYLILWFTPNHCKNNFRKHIFWDGKKNNIEWY